MALTEAQGKKIAADAAKQSEYEAEYKRIAEDFIARIRANPTQAQNLNEQMQLALAELDRRYGVAGTGTASGAVGSSVPVGPDNSTDLLYRGKDEDYFTGLAEKLASRPNITADMTEVDRARALAGESRGAQTGALGMYLAAAQGKGPSVAQDQLQAGLDASMRAQASMAASARGGGLAAAAAQRQSMINAGGIQSGAANAAAQIRAKEMQDAMAGYAAQANAIRSSDMTAQEKEAALAKLKSDLEIKNREIADKAAKEARDQGQLAALREMQGRTSTVSKEDADYWTAVKLAKDTADKREAGLRSDKAAAEAKSAADDSGVAGGLVSSIPYIGPALKGLKDATMPASDTGVPEIKGYESTSTTKSGSTLEDVGTGASSDKRAKKDIRPADSKLHEFLSKLKALSYEYKDPSSDGEGEFVSPMAQDLEKTALGNSFVKETSGGKKMVDYGHALGAMLASQVYLNKRLDALEAKKGKK